MGYSADAMLFYGINIGVPDEIKANDVLTKETIAKLMEDECCEEEEEIDLGSYLDSLDPYDSKDDLGMGSWGDFDDSCSRYLYVKEIAADWCGSTTIDPSKDLDIDPTWDGKIKAFCEKHGLQYKQPAWHLAARYG